MERPRNESNGDMNNDVVQCMAEEIFTKVYDHLDAEEVRQLWKASQLWKPSPDQFSDMGSEGVPQQLISGATFRYFSDIDYWLLENIWDSVNVSQLDDIRRAENFECYVNYHDNIRTALAKNNNVVLFRFIKDWSREDGSVLSNQIIWSGSFRECERLVELFGQSIKNNTYSVQLRREEFCFHSQLKEQFISRHKALPKAAAFSALCSSPTVIIDQELLDRSDDKKEILCVICHDNMTIGFPAKELPCKHLFHARCISEWYFRKLNCPACRDEFQ